MSTQPKTIDDISRTKTAITGTERLPGRDELGDFKITIENLVASLQSVYIGEEIKYFKTFKPISSSFPWWCMSYPSQVMTTANFAIEFIDKMREQKWTYDEAGSSPVSSFSGAWASNVFTLDNNATNIAFLTELLEDWVFHGSPATGWRILHDGTNEFNITNIVLSTRQITVNLDSKTATGTSIEIYTNRVYGSTTSCRHFSEAGLADYQAGGSKFAGALRRDKFQGWQAGATSDDSGSRNYYGIATTRNVTANTTGLENNTKANYNTSARGSTQMIKAMNDGTNGDPRTGSETQAKSATVFKYLFVGSYTA